MDELIYRQDAGNILCDWCDICPKEERDIMHCDDVCPQFARIPSIDAVEVVRCKDCTSFCGDGMYCDNNILVLYDHFYCYYGERKADETD